jgi:hypothetical protein
MLSLALTATATAKAEERVPLMRRFTLDLAWQGTWSRTVRPYDFYVRDPATDRQATGEFRQHDAGVSQGATIDTTIRIRSRLGLGIEGMYQRRLTAQSNPMFDKVDVQFGHRELFGISGLAEYTHQGSGYLPRGGFVVQQTIGMYWFRDHAQRGPSVVGWGSSSRGIYAATLLGYRIAVADAFSVLGGLYGGIHLLDGLVLGLRVGAGWQ